MAKKTEKKKISVFAVVLYVLNALVWIVTCVFDIIENRTYFLSYIHYACAGIWILASVVLILKYRKSLKKIEPEKE